jgi:hypothetical protein
MASRKGAHPPKGNQPTSRAATQGLAPALPRPLPPYRSEDPELDAVLLPLLARAEPERERPLDLEHARRRLVEQSQPGDARHIIALLQGDALDLGTLPPAPTPTPPRPSEERTAQARAEQARAARLAYLSLLFAAACLHPVAQEHLALLLRSAHAPALKERLALQVSCARCPLGAPLQQALLEVLQCAPALPSPEERNLLSNAARALQAHLDEPGALAQLQPFLGASSLAAPGGIARAQMILTDLDTSRLAPGWRPVLRTLLHHPALAPFACDLLGALPTDPDDAVEAGLALAAQLDQGSEPDGYLLWLLARAPHPQASPLLLRALDAEFDPDWQTALAGLERLDDPGAAQPLLAWIERHRKLTGRPGSWDGYDAARRLAQRLARRR